jgi:predicted enzyme related to lactoylglutathione lyase
MAFLHRVLLPVGNIEKATRFYQQVLGQPGERVFAGRHQFRCGQTLITCYHPKEDPEAERLSQHPEVSQYLYFAVPDLEDRLAIILAAGGIVDTPIARMPWGERLFYARDPDDNPICFVDQTTI